jgi:Trk K+ transport system NAD-binding subunit
MTHPATLRDAGIERAAAVIMLADDDTTNLEAALLAHELNPKVRVVLRMSNSRVSERLEEMLRRSLFPHFQLIDSVEGSAPHCLHLCGAAGAGPGVACAAVEGLDASDAGPVIVCGLGRLGYGVVKLLKGRVPLVVIDNAPRVYHADEPAMVEEPVVPLVRGDMTARAVLEQASVRRASAVLLLTPNDTDNLEAAMLVHEINPRVRIVMRITNSRISRRLDAALHDAFGANLRIIDPAEHAAPLFVDAIAPAYADGRGAAGPEKHHAPATAVGSAG